MKVLMIAYGCEPDKGSEPGVGWGWAHGMAHWVDLTVITRANNQPTIEAWYQANDPNEQLARPKYVYYDPPQWILWLKRRKWLPTQAFFALWMVGVVRRFRDRLAEFDLVHHVNYSSIVLPGLWWASPIPVILGPVGGTSTVSKHYLPLYGDRVWKERLRAFMIRRWHWMPWIQRSFRKAAVIACANSEAAEMIGAIYPAKTRIMTEIGADRAGVVPLCDEPLAPGPLKLVWIGMMEPWKAWSIALKAMARAREMLTDDERGVQLTMLGRGREESNAERMARDLKLENSVTFLRRVSLADLNSLISEADAMIFSSIKDTSGTVVLEAMTHGKPLICLRHQGVGDITTPATALRVEPGPLDETIEGFAQAIVRLIREPGLARQLGAASRERVLSDYVWDVKAERMFHYYGEAVKHTNG